MTHPTPKFKFDVIVSNVGLVANTNHEYEARYAYKEWCQAVVSTKAARFIGESVSLFEDDEPIETFQGHVGEWSTNPFKSIATVAEQMSRVEDVEAEMEAVTNWTAIDPATYLSVLLARIAIATGIRCHMRTTPAGFEWMAYNAP